MNDGSGFQKRRQVLEMLDAGLVMLHLDPRPPDVIVPQRFKSDPVLRLNLAYQFRLPALDIGADGIYAVLSFDKQNFGCTLPWSAIFAVTRPNDGHDGVVWPDSVPPELRGSFTRAGVVAPTRLKPAPEAAPEASTATRPGAQAEGPADAPPEAAPARPAEGGGSGLRPVFIVHEGGRDTPADGVPSLPPAAESPPELPTGARRRGHLTLIKG